MMGFILVDRISIGMLVWCSSEIFMLFFWLICMCFLLFVLMIVVLLVCMLLKFVMIVWIGIDGVELCRVVSVLVMCS